MSEIERLNMIAEWQEQHKQLIEDLENSKKRIAELEKDFLKACKVREQVCKEAEQACERKDKRIAELETQIEKMKNQKVFLLQRVDTDDHTIDKWLYTTDEELAKEWNKYVKHSYWYGQAIELEEFSDKERIKEELEND